MDKRIAMIGTIVTFRNTDKAFHDANNFTDEAAAIVTRVWDESGKCVNLCVVRDNNTPVPFTSVNHQSNHPGGFNWRFRDEELITAPDQKQL